VSHALVHSFELCVLDGPYGVFAGRDASRGLATFSLSEEAIKDEYDDLSDLNSMMMDSVREWEMQFTGVIFVHAVIYISDGVYLKCLLVLSED